LKKLVDVWRRGRGRGPEGGEKKLIVEVVGFKITRVVPGPVEAEMVVGHVIGLRIPGR
jgi:hypothetical protein